MSDYSKGAELAVECGALRSEVQRLTSELARICKFVNVGERTEGEPEGATEALVWYRVDELHEELARVKAALPPLRARQIAEGLEWNEPNNTGAISSAKELRRFADVSEGKV